MNFDIIKDFFYSPTGILVRCLKKKTILKFTLKRLRHVSVLQLHHHQGALSDDGVTVTPKHVGAVLM